MIFTYKWSPTWFRKSFSTTEISRSDRRFPAALSQISRRFDSEKRSLLSLSKETEVEFIAFGREVRTLSTEAKEIVMEVEKVVELATGEEPLEAMALFEELVLDAHALISTDEREIDELIHEIGIIREALATLVRQRSAMEQSTRLPLSVLRTGFRMECVSMDANSARVFESVSTAISGLSEKLKQCSEIQFASLEIAARSMETMWKRLVEMRDEAHRQYGDAGDRIGELKTHAAHLREAGQQQSEAGGKIRLTSQNLREQFSCVVMALQYHDITRQQLEHVGEAFDKMQEWMPQGEPPVPMPDGVSLALLHDLSLLQIKQTNAALASLRTAGSEFSAGMKSIEQFASELAAGVSTFRAMTANERVFKALAGLTALQNFVSDRAKLKREVGEAGCESYFDVTDFVQTIHELTTDLRLLAINVQIQAAHSGNRGVIVVLAENVCQISESTQVAAEEIAQGMQQIRDRLSDLAQRAWALGTETTPEGRSVVDGVPRCVALVSELQERLSRGMAIAHERHSELRERVRALLPKIRFPQTATRRLEEVIGFFDEIRAETESDAGGDTHHHILSSIQESYTMASERHVHASVLKRQFSEPSRALGTELFVGREVGAGMSAPDPSAPKAEEAVSETSTDLGSNIELF